MKWKTETFQSLKSADLFSESLIEQLEALHIETIEDLVAIMQIESLPELLRGKLDIEKENFDAMLGIARGACGTVRGSMLESLAPDVLEEMPFHCNEPTEAMVQELGLVQAQQITTEYMLSTLKTTEVNHIPSLSPVRSQGKRGTCVAFGTVAMREFLDGCRHELSEQYLYWGAKMRDGQADSEGTWISYAMDCLEEDGVCLRKEWPYNPLPGKTKHQGPPPDIALKSASAFKISKKVAINPKSVNDLRTVLLGQNEKQGRIISFAVPVFKSWHQNPITYRTGKIVMPLPGETHTGGHCMCLVGFQDDPEWPGGGFFILRNSWGEKWGSECPFGAGYGTIPYKFIALHCWDTWTAETGSQTSEPKTGMGTRQAGYEEKAKISPNKTEKKKRKKAVWILPAIIALTFLGIALFLGLQNTPEQISKRLETIYERFLLGDENLRHTYMERANQAFAVGEFEKAAKTYSSLLEIEPNDIDALTMKGKSLYTLGNLEEAIACFEQACTISDNEAGIHYQLGILYLEANKAEQSRLFKNGVRLYK